MQYGLTIATEPAVEPLNVQEARDYSRVDITADDELIRRQITAGRKLAEQRTRRTFITTTLDLWLPYWPKGDILLPGAPAQSVSFVKYRDQDGAWQTVSSSVYELDETEAPGRVCRAYGQSWPTVITRRKAINVRFVAGYGDDAEDVPAGIREAIAAYVLSLYDERGVLMVGTNASLLPFGATHLLDGFMVRDYALSQGDEW